jgi:hypothetical protein
MVSLVYLEVQVFDEWITLEVLRKVRDNLREWTGKPELGISFKNYDGLEVGPDGVLSA